MRRCKFCERRTRALYCSLDCRERCRRIDEAHAMGVRQRLEPELPFQWQSPVWVAVIAGVELPVGELEILRRRRTA